MSAPPVDVNAAATQGYYQATQDYLAAQQALTDAKSQAEADLRARAATEGEKPEESFIARKIAEHPAVKAAQARIDKAQDQQRQYIPLLNSTQKPDTNSNLLADQRQRRMDAGLPGLTDHEMIQAGLSSQQAAVSRENARLTDMRGWASIQIQQGNADQKKLESMIRAQEFEVAQAMKRYELGVNASTQAIALVKMKGEADQAYYDSIAPEGTSEYFRQLAAGNLNAPRPTGGIAVAQPQRDIEGEFKAMLGMVLQGGATSTASVNQVMASKTDVSGLPTLALPGDEDAPARTDLMDLPYARDDDSLGYSLPDEGF